MTISEMAQQNELIRLDEKIYREKIFIGRKNVKIIGKGTEKSVISYGDFAYNSYDERTKYGTFRSYTAYFGCERLYAENLTIENTAGDGSIVGQAVAAYVDCRYAYFKNVHLKAFQDTLFITPLPIAPRTAGSFVGPNENKPRIMSTAYFENCYIEGTIDFIFGGGTAVFDRCHIHSLPNLNGENGFISAPCTDKNQKYGFIFLDCELTGERENSVFLGRPWREYAKTAYINCKIGSHIVAAGWDPWGSEENKKTACFCESGYTYTNKRSKWSHMLTDDECEKIRRDAEKIKQSVIF